MYPFIGQNLDFFDFNFVQVDRLKVCFYNILFLLSIKNKKINMLFFI